MSLGPPIIGVVEVLGGDGKPHPAIPAVETEWIVDGLEMRPKDRHFGIDIPANTIVNGWRVTFTPHDGGEPFVAADVRYRSEPHDGDFKLGGFGIVVD